MAISSRSLPDNRLIQRFGLKLPVIQAPMAGVSTPEMAAAVSNAGGLGSIALGAADLEAAHAMLSQTRALTERPFNANLFCHAPARPDPAREAAWLSRLTPEFARFNAVPPIKLQEIYPSACTNTPLLELLLAAPPAVISLHFGLLPPDWIARLKSAGSYLIASATNLDEARACVRADIDAVVAQGWEAGGHRGMFDPQSPDAELSTAALVQLLRQKIDLPVIAAGGIMDAAGIQAARDLGAACAQMGTAFIAC
ncbi:MAG: nitronate monooxygenase, partial [Mangrovicoccus sp.]|nr:nitronate monooxygenase [Mangrovicoccus sp.]